MSRKFVAVLDTMWGTVGRAPKYFYINPRNHSGKRLYWLAGCDLRDLLVVNACPELVGHATTHGKPDAAWLARSLRALPIPFHSATLLICGKVAQRTFAASGIIWRGPTYSIDHPAARRWSRSTLDATRSLIQTGA